MHYFPPSFYYWNSFTETAMYYYCFLDILLHVNFQELFFDVVVASFPTFLHEEISSYNEHSLNVCSGEKGRIITYEHLPPLLGVMRGTLQRYLTGQEVPTEQSRDIFWDENCRRRRQ